MGEKRRRRMRRENDKWIGKKINEWTIEGSVSRKGEGIKWICRCSCGREKEQKAWNVKSGNSRMCKACSGKLRRRGSEASFMREGEEKTNGNKDNK